VRAFFTGLILVALASASAQSALAGAGNGTMTEPPGLLNARMRTQAACERQIARELERYEKILARLEQALAEAELTGDLELTATLQDQIAAEVEKHERKMSRIQQKLENKLAKFEARILR